MWVFANFRIFSTIFNLLFALLPAIAAPPKDGFIQGGQPEMQQAMDNMKTEHLLAELKNEGFIKKRESGPVPLEFGHLVEPLNDKTSILIFETQNLLNRVRFFKEKRWIHALALRLKWLATALENSIENEHPSIKRPFPVGKFISSTVIPFKVVSTGKNNIDKIFNEGEEVKKATKVENSINVGNANNDDRVVDGKSAKRLVMKEANEVDDLVQELRNVRVNTPSTFSTSQSQLETISEVPTSIPPTTTSPTAIFTTVNADDTKKNMLSNLKQQVEELKQLGSSREEIMKAMDFEEESGAQLTDRSNKQQKNEFSNTEFGDMYFEPPLETMTPESSISSTVTPNPKPIPSNEKHGFYNDSLTLTKKQNHPHPDYINRQFHDAASYNPAYQSLETQNGIRNTIRHLKINKQNFMHPNTLMEHPNAYHPFNSHAIPFVGIPGQGIPINNRFYWNQLAMDQHLNQNKHFHPVHTNSRHVHYNMSQNVPKPLPVDRPPSVPAIETQFSDEMKRQLRDGKIVMYSDSVVPTNFDTKENNVTNSNEAQN